VYRHALTCIVLYKQKGYKNILDVHRQSLTCIDGLLFVLTVDDMHLRLTAIHDVQ
jgi:hypothetical protein